MLVYILKDFYKYLKVFERDIGRGIYLSFFLTIIAGLAEGLGISLLIPLFNLFKDQSKNEFFGISKILFNVLNNLNLNNSYWILFSLIILAFLFKGFLIFLTFSYNSILKGKLLVNLKKRLFSNYLRMTYQYYLNNNTGDLTNIVNEQVNLSVRAFNSLYTVGLRTINCIIYLLFAYALAGLSSLIAILGSLFILFVFRWLNSATKRLSVKTAKSNSELSNLTIETLNSFKYLKATNQFKIKFNQIEKSINKLSKYQIKTGIFDGFTAALREPIAVIVIILILSVQLFFIDKPIDSLLVSIILFYRALISTLGVQGSWQRTQEYIGSLEIVLEKLRTSSNNFEKNGSTKITELKNRIYFKNVSFKFDESSEFIIKNLSFELPAFKSIGFVGKSGSGKTTLANLICLLLKPSLGKIYFDKYDSADIDLDSWRNQIGYVSQETTMFDDTISNNISLLFENFKDNKESFLRIKNAASKANIDKFIESLPNGYQTYVGNNGLRLSGGQRQRIFIARELFRNPKILILDEATSALDTISEKAIQESIDLLKGKITIILIAHRTSTLQNTDYLYVLNKGKIEESGKFKNLKNDPNSFFSRLISSQML
ncbi:hypothetical protein B0W81_02365 [Prochlorococcus sp. HOT_208_60]|nr:hypothetical protein B0W81_02365 [Prochlorococcus sp. HOT_208_60]